MSERPQPSPEHVHTVAVVLAQANGTEWDLMPGDDDVYRRNARAILTSDDPAVHAALLAALARAGVLTEKWCLAYERTGDPTMDNPSGITTQHSVVANRAVAEQAVKNRVPGGRYSSIRERRVERRFVTAWQPLTSPTRAQDGPQEPADAPEAPVEPQDATEAR